MKISKIILTICIFLTANNANALFYPSNFEISYKDTFLELQGNYFGIPLTVMTDKNLYQLTKRKPIEFFRIAVTAYMLKDKSWLYENYTGSKKDLNKNIKKFSNILKKQSIYLHGFAIFKNYAILFIETKRSERKMLYVLENHKGEYRICLNFKNKYSKIYNAINKAYHKKGTFKVITAN